MKVADLKKVLVTGGSGFIGSHLVDAFVERSEAEVVIYDNFSTGQKLFSDHHADNPRVRLVEADVLDLERLTSEMKGAELVMHLQANADVRGGVKNRRLDLEQNTIATWNVMEAMALNEVSHLGFASSATVYGEPEVFPTPEGVPLVQTSLYGASKLCGEAMIQAYSEYFGIQTNAFRFVSWTGERYSHGVVFDFLKKLHANPGELEILGDGKQRKSYLDVTDGVNGILMALEHSPQQKSTFNLGHDDFMNVLDLADIVCSEAGFDDVKYRTTGGERGWVGDSPVVHLDTSALKDLGWSAKVSIEDSIRQTVRFLMNNPQLLKLR